MKRFWARLSLLAWFLLAGCQPVADRPANVLLIVVDTLRADRMSLYGHERTTTPHMDRMADTSIVFTRAYSSTSWTNPAMAGIFTGEPPKVLRPGASRFLDRSQKTLAETFRERGYRTGAAVASPVLGPDLGFADGFDSYQGLAGWAKGLERRPSPDAEKVTDAAISWIDRHSDKPWFFYAHYMDPHWPYEPPAAALRPFWSGEMPNAQRRADLNERFRTQQYSREEILLVRALYLGAIAHVDAEIARLLHRVGESATSKTIVAITADHGEELGDHGGVLHAKTLFNEVLHVPLLISGTGDPPRRIDHPVQTIDIGRTLLDFAGQKNSEFPGRSLLAAPRPRLVARLFPLPQTRHRAAVIDGNEKLIATTSDEWLYFNTAKDPGEHQDLAAEAPAQVARLKTFIPMDSAAAGNTADPAVAERMRALGYDF